MKPKNESRIILKQWVNVIIIFVVLLVAASSVYLITKGFLPAKEEQKKIASYNYNANINYKVYLKDNKFFTAKYLGMNGQYITALIDYIEFNPRYNFTSDVDLNYTYNYQIIATAKGSYDSGDNKSIEVWSKAYTILPQTNKTASGKNIAINETVKVDYNTYNNILLDFRKQFGLSINADVDIALKVVINAVSPTNDKVRFNVDDDIALSVPLLNATSTFTPKYTPEGNKTIYEKTTTESSINLFNILGGLILLAISLFVLYKTGRQLLVATQKSEYILEFNKIHKNYSDIIAESDNIPDLSTYDVLSIKKFVDLIDIEEELHVPILCVEIRENYESWFIILHDKTAYRYVLKHEYIKEKKDQE